MLAAIASPFLEEPDPAKAWDERELGDDVVALSYERALSQHARYNRKPLPDLGNNRCDWPPKTAAPVDGNSLTSLANQAPEDAPAIRAPHDASDHDLRTTSVTVRLSKAECERLHQRAMEAGLTVSAYLRSCTIEAEALRTQVKEAMARLRSATGQFDEDAVAKAPGPTNRPSSNEVRLCRVLGHIGKLFLGIGAATVPALGRAPNRLSSI